MSQARLGSLAALLVLLFAAPVLAEEAISYRNLVTPLIEASETIIGQPIVYPEGKAKIAAAIVTLPPGAATGWHLHPVPLFAYVIEGEVTVDYGEKGIKVYRQGEGVLEGVNWPHNGANRGPAPARILAVYMGAEGTANAQAVKAPE